MADDAKQKEVAIKVLELLKEHEIPQGRIDARDHLEHFDERLLDGKNQSKLQNPKDLLNMENYYRTFAGRRTDISPD